MSMGGIKLPEYLSWPSWPPWPRLDIWEIGSIATIPKSIGFSTGHETSPTASVYRYSSFRCKTNGLTLFNLFYSTQMAKKGL